MDDLLESAGDNTDPSLQERLRRARADAAAQAAAERRNAACESAAAALQTRDIDRLSASWVALESFTKDDPDGKVTQMRAVLRTQVVNLQSKAQIEALRKDLERVDNLSDRQLRAAGWSQILQSCTAQQLSLTVENGVADEVQTGLKNLARQVQQRTDALTAARLLAYQKRALKDIKDFSVEFETVHTRVHAQSMVAGEKWLEADYQQVAGTMVRCLTPINTALLDPSVLQLYNRAFETGWKALDDKRSFQEWVAEMASEQPKRGGNDE
jgi:hypothetical protein